MKSLDPVRGHLLPEAATERRRLASPAFDTTIPEEIEADRFLHRLGQCLVLAVFVYTIVDSGWLGT